METVPFIPRDTVCFRFSDGTAYCGRTPTPDSRNLTDDIYKATCPACVRDLREAYSTR